METTGRIMNRRQIEDQRRLEDLEKQEKSLLTHLEGGADIDSVDMSSLEGDAITEVDGTTGGDDEHISGKTEAELQAEAEAKAEADAARREAEDRKREEARTKKDEPKPKLDESDPEFWKKQAETWKKRKGDADRALSPAQEEAAKLRKELEEIKKQREDDRFSGLTREIESLKAALSSKTAPAQSGVNEDEALETELTALRAINPEAARLAELEAIRIRRSVSSEADALRRGLEEISAAKREMEAQRVQEQAKSARESHRAFVTSKHPDVDDIYTYAFDELAKWASEDSPEYLAIVQNPVSVSAQRFAKVIGEFKHYATEHSDSDSDPSNGKPSAGDLATKVRKAALPTKAGGVTAELLSEKEMVNFESIMQSYRDNPTKQDDLLRRFELTIASMES